jgi:multifunctional 2-oxoglutarate metabolism enzyme
VTRVRLAFLAGVGAAAFAAGVARIAGMSEPPSAIADVSDSAPAPAVEPAAAAAPVTAPPRAPPAPRAAEDPAAQRFRAPKRGAREDVSPGAIARVATRSGERTRCPTARKGTPGPSSEGCETGGRVRSVEIEWHAPSTSP